MYTRTEVTTCSTASHFHISTTVKGPACHQRVNKKKKVAIRSNGEQDKREMGLTRSRGGAWPRDGAVTRTGKQAGKALRSQGHHYARVMRQSVSGSLPLCNEGTKVYTATHQDMYTWG